MNAVGVLCLATKDGYDCTRKKGHKGKHQAHISRNHKHVAHEWENKE